MDPYKVLGVSSTASDDEIKQAYRKLAAKYHPDNYTNSPLQDKANEKMQEINAAYDAIMNERRSGSKSANYHNTGYGTANNNNSAYPDVRHLMQNGRVYEAEEVLNGVPTNSRSAEWYYLKGVIFYNRGWLDDAYNYLNQAVVMEPENIEYKRAFEHLQARRDGQFANTPYGNMQNGVPCTACDVCNALMCMNCLCNCCGGGRC